VLVAWIPIEGVVIAGPTDEEIEALLKRAKSLDAHIPPERRAKVAAAMQATAETMRRAQRVLEISGSSAYYMRFEGEKAVQGQGVAGLCIHPVREKCPANDANILQMSVCTGKGWRHEWCRDIWTSELQLGARCYREVNCRFSCFHCCYRQGQLVRDLEHKDRLSPVVGRLPDGGCDMGDDLASMHWIVDDALPWLWEVHKGAARGILHAL